MTYRCLACTKPLTNLDIGLWAATGRVRCASCLEIERHQLVSKPIETLPSLPELIVRPVTRDDVLATGAIFVWFLVVLAVWWLA